MGCAHGWDTWEEPRVPSKAVKGDGLQLGHEEGVKGTQRLAQEEKLL